jgi:major membrane immunogen (membrane-anchored lipoprotein)
MTIIIADKFDVDETAGDPNYKILNVETSSNNVIYTVSQQGYTSKIKLEITINKGKITTAKIIEAGDSFFSKVVDANYIDKLISEQKNLNNCDAVSGATISSTAVKKAFINTLDDYNKDGYKKFDKNSVSNDDEDEPKVPNFVINSKVEAEGKFIYNVNEKSFGNWSINGDKLR